MKILTLFILSLSTTVLYGQRNYALYNMESLPQNHYYNPAMRSTYKLSISLPLGMQSFGGANTGFRLNDILTKRADDSLVVNPAGAIGRLKKNNFLEFNSQNEIVAVAIGKERQYFSFSAIARSNFSLNYPKDFYTLLLEGNGKSLLGKRADMDGLGVSLNSYMEYAFGYNIKLLDRITAGARVKLLSGMANATTRKSKLGLTTDEEDFSLTLDGELDLRTSGVIPLISDSIQGRSPISNAASFANGGFAIDLGTSIKLTEKLTINAALNDIGFIKWKSDVYNYKKENLSYTFSGIDLQRAIQDSTYLDRLADTLVDIFKLEKDNEAYTQALPVRIIVGGQYDVSEKLTVFSTLFSDFTNKTYRPTFILGGSVAVRNWLRFSTNYMATTNSLGNLGMAVYLRGFGVQFFLATDNIAGALNFANNKNFHLSTGLALTFGKP